MTMTEYDLAAKAVKPTAWHRPRTLLACGTLALALALTACGSSAKPSPSVPRSTTATSAVQSTAASSAAQSTAASPASAGNMTGTWNGTTDSSAGQDVVDLTVLFTQQGPTLSGSITTDSGCFRGGTVSGTNNGATVDFVAVSGSQKVTFKASSSGRHMQGTYQAVTSCGNDNGNFELSGPA